MQGGHGEQKEAFERPEKGGKEMRKTNGDMTDKPGCSEPKSSARSRSTSSPWAIMRAFDGGFANDEGFAADMASIGIAVHMQSVLIGTHLELGRDIRLATILATAKVFGLRLQLGVLSGLAGIVFAILVLVRGEPHGLVVC
jgi:hypothetical protein